MAKLLIIILVLIILFGGGYFLLNSGKVGVSDKQAGSSNILISQPTPDISDAGIDEDLTALDKDLAESDSTDLNISQDIQGL